jgi:hypothetical protein
MVRVPTGIDATYLAVVLLLVAFFALLSTKAERSEARQSAVLASLSAAFASAPAGSASGASLVDPAWLDLVEGLRAAVGDAATIKAAPGGTEVRVDLPASAIFLGDGASPDPRRGAMLDGIAHAIASAAPNVVATLMVGAAAEDGAVAARRAARLAFELVSRGVDPAALTAGAAASGAEGLELAVRWELPSALDVQP